MLTSTCPPQTMTRLDAKLVTGDEDGEERDTTTSGRGHVDVDRLGLAELGMHGPLRIPVPVPVRVPVRERTRTHTRTHSLTLSLGW